MGAVTIAKVPGADNPADILTKYVERSIIHKALKRMGMVKLDGRPECAPATAGI